MKIFIRKKKYILYPVLCIVILCFPFFLFYFTYSFPHDRIRESQLYLVSFRSRIDKFRETEGKYPDSLRELMSVPYKEYISSLFIGNRNESKVLNGRGGWYYDPNPGGVRINLTKPVKHYLRFYLGKERNEIPADW